ncbi:amino acid adenylation domain-containing protein [Anabaena lutea]|uniref:Amino acid adenylation domain-containing protein n=1 Tax=Anabaena lutea FACHB-196 TaxID=2692881 RepID=A0ABR8FLD3_9NOST|nr:non-ribosomal peptide synthetase [Anabaena lutea]MBD2569977.1 amino acid adenylation domain-containing protein [Anabaena lutea FACHB-196]
MKSTNLEDSYQLSPLQEGMLFNSLIAQQSGVDIEQVICLVQEKLDVNIFQQAWLKVVERHAILRSSFDWSNENEPLQLVHKQVILSLEEQDWSSLSDTEQKHKLRTYLQSDRTLGFQLNTAPLMRLALFQLSESVYQFVWTFHHALLDGRSLLIILKEVFTFYQAFYQGKDIEIMQPHSYKNHIQWLHQQDWSKSASFWQQLLKGFTAPTPLLLDQNPHQKSGFGEQEIRLSAKNTQILEDLAKQHQLTLNTLIQAAWAILLSRYSGESDVVFGATRACRYSSVPGSESMVGQLTNTLPIRVKISGETPVLPWLKELRSQWLTLREYEHTPLVKIQGWSDVAGGSSLFNSLVVFENYELNQALYSHDEKWKNWEVQLEEQTNYPLTLVGNAGTELLLKIKYDQRSFNDDKILRMLGHLQTLLSSIATNPWQTLGELPLLTADEQHQILIEWNHTAADFNQQICIHQLFESQVEKTPEAVAVVFEQEQLTYQELNFQANQLAHKLKELGVKPGVLVAVYLERSLEMIPAILGILKAGGAYVPLEPSFPQARIQLLLSSLQINCLVTQTKLLSNIQELETQLPALQHLICLDKVAAKQWGNQQIWNRSYLDQLPKENLNTSVNSDDIAYIIFTSGSTGTPKGVVVRHQPVINLISWVNKTFNVNSSDRILFITSLCFDLSVYDIFGLLAAGGSIRVVSNQDVRDPEALLNILCHEPITFWDSAPPALQQLASLFPTVKSSNCHPLLRLVFMSGDWIPVTLPDLLKTTFPEVEVISLGGATEATVWSNYYPIGKVEAHWKSIPYGKPIQNAQYYILDSYLNPCPIGVAGDLYIGGVCLASGYLNQPELTAQKFIPNPFSKNHESRLYKTGDLARYFPDGNIEFLGRIDHQVKIRGFRIELGEIESVLAQHPGVEETVVIAREDEPGYKRLVAYIVLNQQYAPKNINELRQFLQKKLPEYMIPCTLIPINYIPLTANGKVNRSALPIPDQTRPNLEKAFIAPSNAIEFQLTEIWKQVLGINSIGVKDNFFELGGHSLLAVKLFTQIEQKLGKKLPLATLFHSPTIEELANILSQENDPVSWSSLVAIQSVRSSKPPLFLVHALGGNIIGYQTLVRYLDSEQPIYGLQAQGLDGKQPPHTRVEDMAAHYIQEIRTVQPHGPYLLAGFSSGGIVAFEMGQQLAAQGEQVALLAMFDTYNPRLYIENPSLSHTMYAYGRTLLQLSLRAKWYYFLAKMDWLRSLLTGNPHSKYDLWNNYTFSEDSNPDNMEFIETLKRATMADYVPQAYPGRVTLFTTKEMLRWCRYETDRGWKHLAQKGLDIYDVPGTHLGMLDEPNVQVLAEKLQVCLEQAQENYWEENAIILSNRMIKTHSAAEVVNR